MSHPPAAGPRPTGPHSKLSLGMTADDVAHALDDEPHDREELPPVLAPGADPLATWTRPR